MSLTAVGGLAACFGTMSWHVFVCVCVGGCLRGCVCVCVHTARSYAAISWQQKPLETHSCYVSQVSLCLFVKETLWKWDKSYFVLFVLFLLSLFLLSICLPLSSSACLCSCVYCIHLFSQFTCTPHNHTHLSHTHVFPHDPPPLHALTRCSPETKIDEEGSCPVISTSATGADGGAGISLP